MAINIGAAVSMSLAVDIGASVSIGHIAVAYGSICWNDDNYKE